MSRRAATILSGGVGHPFAETSRQLAGLLAEAGFDATVRDDIEGALAGLRAGGCDLLVVNALRWRMLAPPRYAHLREAWALELSGGARAAIEAHLARGGGLLAMHAAAICFDDWPRWGEIIGAAWDWERSRHPPVGHARVTVATDRHPIVAGIGDFTVVDEIYGFLDEARDLEPLAWSAHGGRDHPVLWARTVGGARVVYDALGHDQRSLGHDTHRQIVRRAALWAAGERSGRSTCDPSTACP